MTPVVNDKYKYIMMYSAKVACTSLRNLYIDVHRDEFTPEQWKDIDDKLAVNRAQPYRLDKNYSSYFIYAITRNPYARSVSAFLDQFVYAKHAGILKTLADCPPQNGTPSNYIEFLEYLKDVPDEHRDTHFQSQAYFALSQNNVVTSQNKAFRLLGLKKKNCLGLDYYGDMGDLNTHMEHVFKRVFKQDPQKLDFALQQLEAAKKRNSSVYGDIDYDDAAQISVAELDEIVFAPKPQDFFKNERARTLVYEIYKDDFDAFGYRKDDLPFKKSSSGIEQIPDDFDWKVYLTLNPELRANNINNERSAVRHYLQHGRSEVPVRTYKYEVPDDFEWRRYLSLHADLPAAGISTKEAAIAHYLTYGMREGREIS